MCVQTGGVYDDEGGAVFNEELPVGSQCVVRGAATPTTGPALCLDPSAILYSTGTSCLTTGILLYFHSSLGTQAFHEHACIVA